MLTLIVHCVRITAMYMTINVAFQATNDLNELSLIQIHFFRLC